MKKIPSVEATLPKKFKSSKFEICEETEFENASHTWISLQPEDVVVGSDPVLRVRFLRWPVGTHRWRGVQECRPTGTAQL